MDLTEKNLRILNVTTNIVFPIAAIIIMMGTGPFRWVIGVAAVFLGIASGMYHAYPKNYDFQKLDRFGMYCLGAALTAMWIGLPWWSVLIAWPVFGYYLDQWPSETVLMTMALVIAGGMLATESYLGVFGAILFGVAFLILDRRHQNNTWHPLRHILASIAILLVYFAHGG